MLAVYIAAIFSVNVFVPSLTFKSYHTYVIDCSHPAFVDMFAICVLTPFTYRPKTGYRVCISQVYELVVYMVILAR